MKYLLASLAIVLSISCSSGSAENSAPKDGLTVNFQAATSKGKLYLKERIGGHLFKIDSTTSSDKKTFHLATAGLPTGYYAISFDDKNEVEFIISGEEKMTFSFPGNALGYNNANAGNSVQNVALWKYKIFEKNTQ